MRKILIFCALSALAFGAQNACEEYVKGMQEYLNELKKVKTLELKDDEKAFRTCEIKFEIYAQKLSGQVEMISRVGDEKECERGLESIQKSLNEIKSGGKPSL